MVPACPPSIVVSGIGVVSAWGWGAAVFRDGLGGGGTAIGNFTRFDPSAYASHIAAAVPARPEGSSRRPRRNPQPSWADSFAIAAAREAVAAARLPDDLSACAAGVFFGSTTGGMFEGESFYERFRSGGFDSGPRRMLTSLPASRPADSVARELGITGPVETVSSACASSTLAIGLALEALREGAVRVALAGGADSLCRVTFGGFNSLQSVDTKPCVPFRRDRRGLSLGEGGAVLLLERLEDARARGVTPVAELAGAGASADAYHMTAPEPEGRGAAAALSSALRDADCHADDVDLINAHGTATPLNDLAEFRALELVFGARVGSIPIAATKGSVGHLLGCAGAVEAVATVLALRDQRLQPMPGGGEIDPATPVRLIRDSIPASLRTAVSLNLGFGGCNGALVFRRSRWT